MNTKKQNNTRKEGLNEMKDLMTKRHPLNPKNIAKDAALAGSTLTSATVAMKSNRPSAKATAGAATAKILGKKAIHDAKYVIDWVNAARKILFNHTAWYTKYGSLNSANLQWNLRKQTMSDTDIAAGLTVDYVPTIPMQNGHVSSAYTDAMNMIFAKLRCSNSGAYNYGTHELADYIETARSIYALSASIARDIALLNNVDILSSDSPDVILMVAGLTRDDINDLRNNRSNYIDRLNRLNLTIANLIPLPPQLAYIDRSIYMAQLALRDSDTDKAVPILTRLAKVYTAAQNTQYAIDMVDVPTDIGLRLSKLEELLKNFNGYTDGVFSKVAGDMLKAYGDSAFVPYVPLEVSDKVNLTYDPYLLTQLQNCNTAAMHITVDPRIGDVHAMNEDYIATLRVGGRTSDTGTAYFFASDIPGCMCKTDETESSILINNYKDDCAEGEVLSLTRLCAFFNFDADQNNVNTNIQGTVECCGTEIVTAMSFVYYDHRNGLKRADVSTGAPTTAIGIASEGLLHSLWSQVDYAPVYYIAYEDPTVQAANKPLRFWNKLIDLNVTAVLTRNQLENFNEAVTLSLLKTIDINDQVNFRSSKTR